MSMVAFCTHIIFIFDEYTIGKGIEFESCTLSLRLHLFFSTVASLFAIQVRVPKRGLADGQKGPAAPGRKEEAAHDPRGWIVPGHHQSDVAHRQAHPRTGTLLAFPTTDKVFAIEHANVHVGQAMLMIADLKMSGCAEDASLTMQRLPAS